VKSVECAVLSSLRVLYFSAQKADVRVGSLKILLHVLERCGEKLYYSWSSILEMLRYVSCLLSIFSHICIIEFSILFADPIPHIFSLGLLQTHQRRMWRPLGSRVSGLL
jgi:hypothetical protein